MTFSVFFLVGVSLPMSALSIENDERKSGNTFFVDTILFNIKKTIGAFILVGLVRITPVDNTNIETTTNVVRLCQWECLFSPSIQLSGHICISVCWLIRDCLLLSNVFNQKENTMPVVHLDFPVAYSPNQCFIL